MEHLYNTTKIVSPCQLGGEEKNQDRAVISPSCIYTICDGVTSSPNAQWGAAVTSVLSQTIFNNGNVNLELIANVLMSMREAAIESGISVDESLPESMQELMQEAAQNKLKNSHQTTLVSCKFIPEDNCMKVIMVICGDSGFFAFSPKGNLLYTNLPESDNTDEKEHSGKIPFYPDSEILTVVKGTVSDYPCLSEKFNNGNANDWLCLQAICLCDDSTPVTNGTKGILLKPFEEILAPKYLVGIPQDPNYKEFRRLPFSKFVRRISEPIAEPSEFVFDDRGNTTNVLPDHYYTDEWEHSEERFPKDTSFLLCTDGFYRSFSNSTEMWEWFVENENALKKKEPQIRLLKELHKKLNDKTGDDDISFIWLSSKEKKDI